MALWRKNGPAHRTARWFKRNGRDAAYEALRVLSPRSKPSLGPAKGFFSAFDELRAGNIQGGILLTGQETKSGGPGSLREAAKLGQNGYQPWPVFWTRHGEARLIGAAGLLVNKRKQACSESVYGCQYDGDPGYYLLKLPPPVRLSGNWTSLLSRWSLGHNYYHWFMDCLPRLALLDQLPPDTRILVPAELSDFERTTLQWLGLESRIRPMRENHLVAENFYFSAPTAMTGCANPYAASFLRGKFLSHAAETGPCHEKVYIQRRGKTRSLLNEAEVVAFLQHRGWHVLDMESLTLAEQIHLFRHARAVAGLHGAGFTNLLWCQPGCVAVELVADNFVNGCYEALAGCVGVDHRFLIQEADQHSRIRVKLEELERVLPV